MKMISMRSVSFGSKSLWLLLCFVIAAFGVAQKPGEMVLKQASTHPMRYYISLPNDWKPKTSWEVVVAIESADRDFKGNAQTFVDAQKEVGSNFILVVPEVVTNGGSRYREASGYSYTADDWTRVAKDGEWKFDEDGIASVIADVHKLYGGREKYLMTGWEAGAHTVFAMAFNHPENLSAVTAVCPNYQGRNVKFSSWSSRSGLMIDIYGGSEDPAWVPGSALYEQAKKAASEGKAHGFKLRQFKYPGGHGPMAAIVLAKFGETNWRNGSPR
jgi:hypothetical protein